MSWAPEQVGVVTELFPSLKACCDGTLAGLLPVRASLISGQLVLNPTEEQLTGAEAQETYVVDSFFVEIGWQNGLPYLKMVGDRLPNTAARQGVELVDLHLYTNQHACFSSPQLLAAELQAGISAIDFVHRLVMPYLYGQAIRERLGHWPWPELSHGALGLIEWLGGIKKPTETDVLRTALYLLNSNDSTTVTDLLSKRSRNHHPCPCGSYKRLRNCHPEIKPAVNLLRSAMAQGRLESLRVCVRKALKARKDVTAAVRN